MSRCYFQLTLSDRRRLYQLKERKLPIDEISRQLGRPAARRSITFDRST